MKIPSATFKRMIQIAGIYLFDGIYTDPETEIGFKRGRKLFPFSACAISQTKAGAFSKGWMADPFGTSKITIKEFTPHSLVISRLRKNDDGLFHEDEFVLAKTTDGYYSGDVYAEDELSGVMQCEVKEVSKKLFEFKEPELLKTLKLLDHK